MSKLEKIDNRRGSNSIAENELNLFDPANYGGIAELTSLNQANGIVIDQSARVDAV